MALVPASPISPTAFRQEFGSNAVATAYQAIFNNWLDNTPTIASLLDQNGKGIPFTTTLEAFGFKEYVDTEEISHFERPFVETVFEVIAITGAAGGVGNNMTVSVRTINFASGFRSGPREKEIYRTISGESFYIPTGGVNATVNPNLITIRPIDTTVDLDLNVFAGESYTIKSNASPEGSLSLINSQTARYQKYTNDFQIVEESYGITGSAATLSTFVYAGGKNGPFMLDSEDAVYRNEKEKSAAILWGQVADNITSTDNVFGTALNVNSTEGIYTFYDEQGNAETYTQGAFQIADFENVDRYYITQNFSNIQLLWWCGHELQRQVSRVLKEYVTETNVKLEAEIAGRLGVENGFMAFKKDGRAHIVMRAEEFNDARAGGGTGYGFPEEALIVPMGWNLGTDNGGYDVKGSDIPLVGYACRAKDGYIRDNILVQIDGTGKFLPITNVESDAMKFGYRSEIAAHPTRHNLGTVIKPV